MFQSVCKIDTVGRSSDLTVFFFSQDAMEVMGVVAVMVNLALLGMGGSVQRMFPNMTVTDRIILIVVLEVSLNTMTSWTIVQGSCSSHRLD